MKIKHNKKRNTAFLYESLIKELTKAIVNNNNKQKETIIKIIKENFNKSSILSRDLEIYKYFFEAKSLKSEYAKRFMAEVKKDYWNIDRKKVFNCQTRLIKQINESLSPQFFANFISNYKDIASIGQYLNSQNLKPQARLIVEDRVYNMITSKSITEAKQMQHIDKLTYKTFVDKFNKTYGSCLRKEQKDLLTNYIVSFSDNGLGLKVFLNEEISRLKEKINTCLQEDKVKSNEHYRNNMTKILEKLNSFSKKPINESLVKDVFYIQDLTVEILS